MLPFQKQLAASICIQTGEHYVTEKDYDNAVKSYKDALSYSPTDNKVRGLGNNTVGAGEVAGWHSTCLAPTEPWLRSPFTTNQVGLYPTVTSALGRWRQDQEFGVGVLAERGLQAAAGIKPEGRQEGQPTGASGARSGSG